MSLLDNLTPEAIEELRGLVQEEIQAALAQHEERRRWLSIEEAAVYLDVSTSAIRGRVERNSIPSKRLGRSVLIDRDALDVQINGG